MALRRLAGAIADADLRVELLWKSSVSGPFRYLALACGSSARPPNDTIRPRPSVIGKMMRSR